MLTFCSFYANLPCHSTETRGRGDVEQEGYLLPEEDQLNQPYPTAQAAHERNDRDDQYLLIPLDAIKQRTVLPRRTWDGLISHPHSGSTVGRLKI